MCKHLRINTPTSIHTYTALYTWKSFKYWAHVITYIHQRGGWGSYSPNFSFDNSWVYISLFTLSPWPRFEAPSPCSFLFSYTIGRLQPHEGRLTQTSVNPEHLLAAWSSVLLLIPLTLNLRHKKLGKCEVAGMVHMRTLRSRLLSVRSRTVQWHWLCWQAELDWNPGFGQITWYW